MPGPYTYPGVYVQEVPSGVHPIAGVSTSVTAFVGWTPRGPVNSAGRVRNFAEFTRAYGGLSQDSELSYAVYQFFRMGGSEAWIVRVADQAKQAARSLPLANNNPVLDVTAKYAGESGNAIEIRVDYDTPLPESTFNLTVIFDPDPADLASRVVETFPNVSMNDQDPGYVVDVVKRTSDLVEIAANAALPAGAAGTLTSGPLANINQLRDDRHDSLLVQVDGSDPVPVRISANDVAGGDDGARLVNLCAAIRTQVQAAGRAFDCQPAGASIQMTSTQAGLRSAVRVLAAAQGDLSSRLRLEPAEGARIVDGAAVARPALQPTGRGTLTGARFNAQNDLPALGAAACKINISLDGRRPETATLDSSPLPAAANSLATKLQEIAIRIRDAVQELRPGLPAYDGFTCTVANSALQLASGTQGKGSSVSITPAPDSDIATGLRLTPGLATVVPVLTNFNLLDGKALPYTSANAYPLFAPPAGRGGIYALEVVDLFNLLCLPGVTNTAILDDAAAFCERRRAFLIVDPPQNLGVDAMERRLLRDLPKSRNAATYYPWIKAADPLTGRTRPCPPSGAMAGLYARTDSARGVWKAPAGTEAALLGVPELERTLTDAENGTLNRVGVNCLRTFPGYGSVAWGARTLRGSDDLGDEYKYVPVRRLALFIEESLYRGLKWVVFEPNDEPLWSQIRLNAGAFMNDLFRRGAFQGKTPREAYLVKCDRETTTQSDINNGIVNVLVGFAPLRPAEFVIIMIQQLAGQVNT